jgi:drug/metabolite transporter (DMT)-like permease
MTRTQKLIGIIICVIGAVVLAWFSLESTDSYWVYLVLAGLLGVAAGVIRNLPDKRQ